MNTANDTQLVTYAAAIVKQYFGDVSEPAGGKGYRVEHANRVKTYLEKFLSFPELADHKIDVTALLVAGLLHDLGDVKRISNGMIDYNHEVDHTQAGADLARAELISHIKDPKLLDKICGIILNHHNYEGEVDIETKLVQDADQLEELGYLNMWQTFQYSFNRGRNLTDTITYWHTDGLKRKQQCVANCNFSFTKRIAEKRLAKMEEFYAELTREQTLADSAA